MKTQTQTAANVKQAVPFFMVEDMLKSLRFYVWMGLDSRSLTGGSPTATFAGAGCG